jgi:hypothetical protein
LRFLTQHEVAVARPEHQKTSILFIFGFLPKWYLLLLFLALVLLSLGTVSLALLGNLIHSLSSDHLIRDTWHTCHDSFVFSVLLASSFFVCVLLLIPHLSQEIWGMKFPNLTEVFRVECLLLAFAALVLWQLTLL